MRVSFGACEFDASRHVLLRHGRPIALSPRAFRLLELLLDRRPEAVTKADLLEHLWPDSFVSDASLHNLIAEVRAAIGDTPRAARFIRTVPRYGYAFHGDARSALTPVSGVADGALEGPHLVSSGRDWRLAEGSNEIGRDPTCAVRVESPGVSRRHARIVVAGAAATLEDLGSKNGCYVNDRRVVDAVRLEDGSRVRVGSVTMVYRRASALASTVTQRPG